MASMISKLAVTRPVFRGLRPKVVDLEDPGWTFLHLAVTRPVFRGLRLTNPFNLFHNFRFCLAVTRPVFRGLRLSSKGDPGRE